ncbi:thioredoxin domain-containing protein [Flavihumibacter solisilvae]|uniref:Spermatogenesis-associated protein 20-like TRX domain-containing protein n=1 Tax=Flavihumibacter solisilvae TaxID=1349421 RepID=A0A0C1IVU0_9BACT|nr:thioredoxin domain-containing protein [Flavihumibacter solisilvae]KIC94579.1 hypothetical protein OI18_10745 [Flavihumibacter solisilvae]
MQFTNRLAAETSPYLLQHAHNPVDWYPWGDEALQAAQQSDKPILVSIGYAACHWCHVMERESFEDASVATLMNEHFVNIKIDREERPDLDHIYMDAVQSMTGSGGWPLNVFLTPEGKPFYGGTYYPPVAAFNRPSWTDVVNGVSNAWRDRRDEINQQAENLTSHLVNASQFGVAQSAAEAAGSRSFTEVQVHEIAGLLMKNADRAHGGFGQAPKFPQTHIISYLLRYEHFYKSGNELEQALLSLDKMIAGGIYDQLGGGLARYSTDGEWLVPHFEKMLYDQALFIGVLADAFRLTHDKKYERVIHQTMEFIQREMLSPEGGFYAALDADSEGEEGKFYVWEKGEFDELLGDDSDLACAWYGVTAGGNWEGVNILTGTMEPGQLSAAFNLDQAQTSDKLDRISTILMSARDNRIRPGLDDKLLLGWNAMMNTACSKAYAATGTEAYRELAIRNMEWMLKTFSTQSGDLLHTYKSGQARFFGFLDDYAYLVQALIYLQELTGNQDYIIRAEELTAKVMRDFGEADNHLFYYTDIKQKDVVLRKREVYDGAQPSGNAIMLFNVQYLGRLLDKPLWIKKANDMLESMMKLVVRYPGSFGCWALELMRAVRGSAEIVVVGPAVDDLRREILSNFIPFRILQSASQENQAFPLLRNKPSAPDTWIYVCEDFICRPPVTSVREMIHQIQGKH